MIISGYLASILIGISLGLIGGGGSILTVPVLVYLFSLDAVLATTYSLFIVGSTSVAGSVSYFLKGLVNLKISVFFGLPSVAAVLLTRRFILPAIPSHILTLGGFTLTRSILLMLLFAVLMILASWSMIKKDGRKASVPANRSPVALVGLQGTATGLITGLIGAGGGFLIIPALVNILKLPMKTAVGTSLFIIAINSLTGFFFSLEHQPVQWPFLLTITAIATAGILIGSLLAAKIDGRKLKPAFGWFVLVMGLYIIVKETLLK
ncbi:MAG: sulfite exporter TauE/SafE family protein [Terrimonas ferruginea]|uniref:sulfite exporter TauE/SafE family protein n=1 Tax=Terrimonas ferruginea TaxID=249 RepID=UPI0009282EEB|nr:sulfite exporter TauE/SafE family protein [Terrimonas ferruginea]MBN8784398.1 sulfite exporter TauE/SafE family protein [Terrimonas ferruginea]OJW45825.1 MAG: permease [Sphingobacteriales bacterium 48-107]